MRRPALVIVAAVLRGGCAMVQTRPVYQAVNSGRARGSACSSSRSSATR
jgi:hypothetical protein